MKSNLISITLAITILFSSCAGKREVTPSPKVDDTPQLSLTYHEFIELNLYDKPFTITDVTSRPLGVGSYKEDISFVGAIGLIAAGAYILFPIVKTTLGAVFLSVFAAEFYAFIPMTAFRIIGGKEANNYRQQLEHLSFLAVEEILHDDLGFNYVPQHQTSNNDSVYSIQMEFDYTDVHELNAINTFSIETDNLKLKNRVVSPNLRVVWTIVSHDGEEVAKIHTSNRLYNIVPNRVHPRNPEFQDSYIELASQSVESFLSLLKGEDDTHVPSSPLAILKNTDARIIEYAPIGQYSFTSLRDRFISRDLSRDQYLITINRGTLAGYEENKKYYVFNTAEEYDFSDYQHDMIEYYWNTVSTFTYDYFLRDYKWAGEFETLLVDEDMSVGIFRPYKSFVESFEKPDQLYFDDLIIRIYNPYKGMYSVSRPSHTY